jgi:hypothetical protein
MIIKLLAVFLLIVSVYLGWWAVSAASWLWLIPAVVLFFAAVGLFLSKRWVQYFWHVMAVVVAAWWVVSVVRIAMSGWPFESALDTVISLIPGLLLVTVCAGGSVVVAKHFRGSPIQGQRSDKIS